MKKIMVRINPDGKYCGKCKYRWYGTIDILDNVVGVNALCKIYGKNLSGKIDKKKASLRLPECLAAEIKED